jgi:hypothetical protein
MSAVETLKAARATGIWLRVDGDESRCHGVASLPPLTAQHLNYSLGSAVKNRGYWTTSEWRYALYRWRIVAGIFF